MTPNGKHPAREASAVSMIVRPEMTGEQVDLIKRTICKDASDDELALFLYQCRRTGLDPLARQIHAVKRWDREQNRHVMSIQTGIDGYWLLADRTGRCAGNEEVEFGPEFEPQPGVVAPLWARATVYKMLGGERVAYTARVRFAEFAARKKDGKLTRFWHEKPYHMLAKCASACALRQAFPQELSGIYTREEMPDDEEPEQSRQAPALPRAKAAPPAESVIDAPLTVFQWIADTEAKLVAHGLCAVGDLQKHLAGALKIEAPIREWPDAVRQQVQTATAAYRESRPLPPAGQDSLRELLLRKGETWERVKAFLSLPTDAGMGAVTLGQWRTLKARLERLGDVEQTEEAEEIGAEDTGE